MLQVMFTNALHNTKIICWAMIYKFESIRVRIVKQCNDRFEDIILDNHALKLTLAKVFSEKYKEELSYVIRTRISFLCHLVAKSIVGMTTNNMARRLDNFTKKWYKSIQAEFVPFCYREFPHLKVNVNSRHVLVSLELDIYKEWNEAMNRFMLPAIKSEIDDQELENLILEAGGLVYFLAGWLLYRLKQNIEKHLETAVKSFTKHNTVLDMNPSQPAQLLTEVLDSSEKHVGKLTRVSLPFFHFVKLLECVYKVNLDNPQIVWAFQDLLFGELLKVTTRSLQLDVAFDACVPANISKEEKQKLLNFILILYSRMRAGDFVRSLKQKLDEANGVADNMQLRSAVIVTQLMASGKVPDVISGGEE